MPKNISAAFILVVAMLFARQTKAQVDSAYFNHYVSLASRGILPDFFLESAVDKYNRDRQQVDAGQRRSDRVVEDQFYIYTNYYADKTRFSGQLIVNDTLAKFVSAVAHKLLKDYPDVEKKLHFYTMRSPYLNAFTTDGGDVYVNVGLLSRLQNEAQLAFVLAHEITHFRKRHVLKGYMNSVRLSSYQLGRKHSFSRTLELEADDGGFNLYTKAGYDPREAYKAFQALALADYPFENAIISPDFFANKYFMIPLCLYAPTTGSPLAPHPNDLDDESATHPSVNGRRNRIKEDISDLSDTTGVLHYFSEDAFRFVSTIARFEEVALLSNDHRYMEAMYSGIVLQKDFPNSVYLQKEILRAMLGYCMVRDRKNESQDYQDVLNSEDNDYVHGGEFGKFRNYLSASSPEGNLTMTFVYGMKLHQLYPADPSITAMLKGVMRDFVFYRDFSLSDLPSHLDSSAAFSPSDTNPNYHFSSDSLAFDVKYMDQLSGKKSEAKSEFWKYAFIPYRDDDYFRDELLHDAKMYRDRRKKADAAKKLTSEMWQDDDDQDAQNTPDTLRMNLSSLIVLSPSYVAIDTKNGDGIDLKETMLRSPLLEKAFLDADSALPLNVHLLARGTIDSNDVQELNLMMYTQDWLNQEDFFRNEEIIPFYADSLNAMSKKMNSNYVASVSMVSLVRPRFGRLFILLTAAYLPLPRVAGVLFTPHHDTFFYAQVYDLKTGKQCVHVVQKMPDQAATKGRIRQCVYNFLYEMNRK